MKIRDPGTFDKAIITMVSAEGYEPWYTDVIRIERFTRELQKLQSTTPMIIDVYAPTVPKLFMYHFDVVTGERTAVPTAGAPDYHVPVPACGAEHREPRPDQPRRVPGHEPRSS